MKAYVVIFWNSDMTANPEVKGVFYHKPDAVWLAGNLFDDLALDGEFIDECGDIDEEDGFYHIEDDDLTIHIEVFEEEMS